MPAQPSRSRPSRAGVPACESLEPRSLLSTYYFSPAGNDSTGNGSQQHPYATIAKAQLLTLHPGDQLLFQANQTFTGSLLLSAADSGTAANPITISSYGSGFATFSSPTGPGIRATDCGGITISNLQFVGPGQNATNFNGIRFLNNLPAGDILSNITITQVDVSAFATGIEFDALPASGIGKNGYTNVSITHSNLHSDADNGIFFQGNFSQTSTKYSFSNVTVSYDNAYDIFHAADGDDTEDGIQLSDVNGGLVSYCTAHDNGLSGNGEVGIWAWDSNAVTIEYCQSYRNHTAGPSDGDGFDLDGGDTNCILQYNSSYDNDGAGYAFFQFLYARPYYNNIIRDNTSTNDARANGYGGIDVYCHPGASPITNCQIYGNTISVSPSSGATPSAVQLETPTTNLQIRDNTFSTTGGVPLLEILAPQPGIAFSGNKFSSNGGPFLINADGILCTNVQQWLAAQKDL
jgi:hypothetical protein